MILLNPMRENIKCPNNLPSLGAFRFATGLANTQDARLGGLGFGVWGLGFGVLGLGFGVWGLGLGFRLRV